MHTLHTLTYMCAHAHTLPLSIPLADHVNGQREHYLAETLEHSCVPSINLQVSLRRSSPSVLAACLLVHLLHCISMAKLLGGLTFPQFTGILPAQALGSPAALPSGLTIEECVLSNRSLCPAFEP